ncbi:MAG: ABC transporter permease, partial [Spirochaetales bacterium]|nr:ABC transporter permease [Spirochaetales bacterium]
MKLISIARRNITRNIRRSILSATAIAVSVLSVLVLFALIEGMTDDMAYNLKTYYTGEIRIRHQDFEQYERYNPIHLTVDWPSIDRALAGNSDIASYTARIPFAASLYLNESNYGVMGVGVDFAREQTIHDLNA